MSDPLGLTAQGLETYTRTDEEAGICSAYIRSLAVQYAPVRLLFGLPRNMDGSYGFRSEKVKAFADLVLSGFEGEHAFYDEPLPPWRMNGPGGFPIGGPGARWWIRWLRR